MLAFFAFQFTTNARQVAGPDPSMGTRLAELGGRAPPGLRAGTAVVSGGAASLRVSKAIDGKCADLRRPSEQRSAIKPSESSQLFVFRGVMVARAALDRTDSLPPVDRYRNR
jgi:hypothetical protein